MTQAPRLFIAAFLILLGSNAALPQTSAITEDAHSAAESPAALDAFLIPSHGASLNAFAYIASGSEPHPTVVLLHGFPGNERNLDLAQSIRRAGWNVVYFDYRGSWGSTGSFSFTHCVEDTAATVAYLRDPANAGRLRIDSKSIVLIGHSLGGLFALQAAATDTHIKAVITISAVDLGGFRYQFPPDATRDVLVKSMGGQFASQGMAPLTGTSPEALANEALDNASNWSFQQTALKVGSRLQLVVTSNDGLAQMSQGLVEAVQKNVGAKVKTVAFRTDHNYSDHRIELQEAIIEALSQTRAR